MPWEQPLQSDPQSVEGPVAKIIAVIIIIVTGLTLAFGDTSGGFRRLIQIVFGLSIAFAASSFLPVILLFGGGCADLMDEEPIAGCRACARPPGADRADPARRRAARGRDHQRHACGRSALACASGSSGLVSGRSATSRPSGPPSAIRNSSTWCAVTCAFPAPRALEAFRHDELAEYRRTATPSRRLPALGRARRRGRRPEQGRQHSSAPLGFRGPDLDSAVSAELVAVAGRLNNAFRRLGSGWAIFVEAQRIPGAILEAPFPIPRRRWSTPNARPISRKRARTSSPAISDLRSMPPAEEAARAESWLYEGRDRPSASTRARRCAGFSIAPTAYCNWSKASCPNALAR
jgi:hypothetical protein